MLDTGRFEYSAVELLCWLKEEKYRFICPTPRTYEVFHTKNKGQSAQNLRDIFGWNLPFALDQLPAALLNNLLAADLVRAVDVNQFSAAIRISSLENDLFIHSSFPTDKRDSVFFGPDSYRFANVITSIALGGLKPKRILDVGCGAACGAVTAARAFERAEVTASDINDRAITYANVNCGTAKLPIKLIKSDLYTQVPGSFDLILANPPFMADDKGRLYRDGGGDLGLTLAQRIILEGLPKLSSQGILLMYTGSPVVAGRHVLLDALSAQLPTQQFRFVEMDPDIFGEELLKPAYLSVERIAAVSICMRRS